MKMLVRQLPAFVDDGLQIGAIRVCGQYAAGAQVQEVEPAGLGCVFPPMPAIALM